MRKLAKFKLRDKLVKDGRVGEGRVMGVGFGFDGGLGILLRCGLFWIWSGMDGGGVVWGTSEHGTFEQG